MEQFLEFLREYSPEVIEAYERYLNRYNYPKVGDCVQSLCKGFGGYGGQKLTVARVFDDRIEVADCIREYVSMKKNWWKELKIISE